MSNAAMFTEIRRLLREAYEHYFATSDGHCKSCEGAISLHFPNYFEAKNGETQPRVEIYSYVLGPNRNHSFNSLAEALVAVREWHAAEMQAEER